VTDDIQREIREGFTMPGSTAITSEGVLTSALPTFKQGDYVSVGSDVYGTIKHDFGNDAYLIESGERPLTVHASVMSLADVNEVDFERAVDARDLTEMLDAAIAAHQIVYAKLRAQLEWGIVVGDEFNHAEGLPHEAIVMMAREAARYFGWVACTDCYWQGESHGRRTLSRAEDALCATCEGLTVIREA
jgi:hypothetical protein